MTRGNLVSVIIANYNKGLYLEQCLNSVLAQTYDNIEIIVVDDCSKDGSLSTLRKYEEKYPKIKVFVNEKNCGVTRTRINAISKASGEYITTLDSDDYYMCNLKIEKEMELIERFKKEHGRDIIAFSNYHLVDIDGGFKIDYAKSYEVRTGDILEVYFYKKKFCPRDFVMSKQQYYSVGG
jgi:glycosyltransferase involved in cell wall biosynthesis